MRMRLAVLLATTMVLTVGSSNPASAAEDGEPSASSGAPYCDSYLRPCGERVVLDSRQLFNGSFELSAFDSRLGLCLYSDHGGQGGFQTCNDNTPPPEGKPINVLGWATSRGSRGRYSEVLGALRSDVASVQMHYRRHGDVRERPAWVTPLTGEIQQQLRLDRPAGVFVLTVKGCVRPQRFRVVAFDADGRQLGSARSPFPRFAHC